MVVLRQATSTWCERCKQHLPWTADRTSTICEGCKGVLAIGVLFSEEASRKVGKDDVYRQGRAALLKSQRA